MDTVMASVYRTKGGGGAGAGSVLDLGVAEVQKRDPTWS